MNADSNSLESLDIRKVTESLGLKVRQRGAKAFIYCPACEPDGDVKPPHHCELGGKKPHLWRCHKCGESGDAVGLVKVVRGCDAAGAFAWLRERSFLRNTRPPQPAQHHDPLQELSARRGWSEEALRSLGATRGQTRDGSPGEVIFPMKDGYGGCTGYKKRRADNKPFSLRDDEVKSLTAPGSRHGLFYPESLPAEGPVLLCEGEADTAAALSAGWSAVVGTAGAEIGKTGKKALPALLHGREVVLVPHPDEAGRRWRDRVGQTCANSQCRVRYVSPVDDKDLDEHLRHEDDKAAALRTMVESALPWQPPEAEGRFFDGNIFIPLRLAKALARERTLCFGFDPESGAGRLMEYTGTVWRPAVGLDWRMQALLGDEVRDNRVSEAPPACSTRSRSRSPLTTPTATRASRYRLSSIRKQAAPPSRRSSARCSPRTHWSFTAWSWGIR